MFYSVEPVLPIRLFARYLYLGKSKSKLTILVCTQCSNKVQLTLHTEKAMASHSSTFAWKIPWTEEPGGLQSMGSLESDTTERLHFHFSLSCIGEGNGNPLQCSCLENPRDGEAWWVAVYGVTQSRTQLKRLSSNLTHVKVLKHSGNPLHSTLTAFGLHHAVEIFTIENLSCIHPTM